MKGKKINLCCGYNILDGYDNYDKYPVDERVNYIDLEIMPLDFKDNSIDEIRIYDGIEHLKRSIRMELIKNFYRILTRNGILDIKMPLLSSRINHNSSFHPKGYFNNFIKFKQRRKEISIENEKVKFYKISFRYIYDRISLDFPFILIKCRWVLMK